MSDYGKQNVKMNSGGWKGISDGTINDFHFTK